MRNDSGRMDVIVNVYSIQSACTVCQSTPNYSVGFSVP